MLLTWRVTKGAHIEHLTSFLGFWDMHKLITSTILALGTIVAAEAAAIKVSFAGFAFRGAAAEEASLYPYTSKLITAEWNQKAIELLKQHPPKHFEIIFNLNDFDQGDTMALACVLDSETVAAEDSGEGHLVRIAMGAEALFIDFKTRTVAAAFPFTLRLTDYLDHPPEAGELFERAKLNLDNSKGNIPSVLHQFVLVAGEAQPRAKIGGTMQVRQVVIEQKSLKFLPKIYAENPPALQFWLAQQFGAELVKHHGIAVLPLPCRDTAMGQMALRFKNRAEVLNLKIPEASYGIDLTLHGFSKTAVKETASEAAWVYGSYIRCTLLSAAIAEGLPRGRSEGGVHSCRSQKQGPTGRLAGL